MLRKVAIAFALLLVPALAKADIPTPVKLTGAERGLLAARLNQQIGKQVYKTQQMPKTGMQHMIGITGGTQISVAGKVNAKTVPVTAPGKFQPCSMILYGPFALSASLVKATPAAPWQVTNFSAVNTRPKAK